MSKEPGDRRPIEMRFAIEVNVSITPHVVQVYGLLSNDEHVMVEFSPFQGIKITAEDCFDVELYPEKFIHRELFLEVTDSNRPKSALYFPDPRRRN